MVHYIEYSALAPIVKDYVICDNTIQTFASTLELLLNALDTDRDVYISAQEWDDALRYRTIANLIDVGCYADFTAHVNRLFNPVCQEVELPDNLKQSIPKIKKIDVFSREEVLTDLISTNPNLEQRALKTLVDHPNLYQEYYATPAIEAALKNLLLGPQASSVLAVFEKTGTFLSVEDIRPFFGKSCFGLSFSYSQELREKAMARLDPNSSETKAFLKEIGSIDKESKIVTDIVYDSSGDIIRETHLFTSSSLSLLVDDFFKDTTSAPTRIAIKQIVQQKINGNGEDLDDFLDELYSLRSDQKEVLFPLIFDDQNPNSFSIALEYAQDENDYAALVAAGYPQAEGVYRNKFADHDQYKFDVLLVVMRAEGASSDALKKKLFDAYQAPEGIEYAKGVEILKALVMVGYQPAIETYYQLALFLATYPEYYEKIPPIMMDLAKAGYEPAIHYLVEMLVDGSSTEFSRLDIATLLTGCKISDCEKERLFPILLQEPKIIREKLYLILAS